jgi:hypothetical protein
MVTLQQNPPVFLQRLGIRRKGLARVEFVPAQMPHQRGLVPDVPVPVGRPNEVKILFPGRQHIRETLLQFATDLR